MPTFDAPFVVCLGAPPVVMLAGIRTQTDVRLFWLGQAIMGAVCAILLLVEVALFA